MAKKAARRESVGGNGNGANLGFENQLWRAADALRSKTGYLHHERTTAK